MSKMMKCGCSSQAIHHGAHNVLSENHETCIIHSCCEVVDEPDLSGRIAKCSYFQKQKPMRRYANDECNYGCRGKSVCECGSQPSDTKLAFFKYCPDKEHDEFYCGCFGWD